MKLRSYLIFMLAFVAFVWVSYQQPEAVNWRITYDKDDKNPYGTFTLNELLPGLFPEQPLARVNRTFYELVREDNFSGNLISLSQRFYADDAEAEALMDFVHAGNRVFLASDAFTGQLADTLGVSTNTRLLASPLPDGESASDTVQFYFTRQPEQLYDFNARGLGAWFDSLNTRTTRVLAASTTDDRPVLLEIPYGKGAFYLCTVPLTFTNYHFLQKGNAFFIAGMLNRLPVAPTTFTNYYEVGRLEPTTPLRFILQTPPLRWAWYIGLVGLALFIVIEARRKQRVIPVVEPPRNDSLTFAKTIGRLYYLEKDHTDLARKKMIYFLEDIRSRYFVRTDELNEKLAEQLAAKTGGDQEKISSLLALFRQVQQQDRIPESTLLTINNKIEEFYTWIHPSKTESTLPNSKKK